MLKISLAELTGNAFALFLDRTGERNLTVDQLKNFGNAVVQDLENQEIDVLLSNPADGFQQVFDNFSEWFSSAQDNTVVVLNDGISVDNLFNKFSGDMTPYAMYAFANEDNFKFLLA